MIFKDTVSSKINDKVKELNKENKDEYYATFSGQKLNFIGDEFKGASANAIFGGVDVDLRNANITQDEIINATAVFGGIDIIVPNNVNVKETSVSNSEWEELKIKLPTWKQVFEEADCHTQRVLVNKLIERIDITQEQIVIRFKINLNDFLSQPRISDDFGV